MVTSGRKAFTFDACTLVACVFLLPCDISCQTVADAKALRTQLFITNGYDQRVRPANNQSLATSVSVVLNMLAINSLIAVSESFVTTVSLTISWKDDQLIWSPATYGGISAYHWPEADLWKPPIALRNSYAAYQKFGDASLNMIVSNDGTVQWIALEVFQSTCSMNIKYYPFDVQTCDLIFVAWGYTRAEVDIVPTGSGFDFEDYQPSPAWDLIDHSWWIEGDPDDVAIIFSLKMRRKPMFVLITMIMPILMLGVLNLFVFLIPCEEGEKVGYSVTVFLALAIFLTIFAGTIPEHSDSACLLSIYLILQTVQSTVITMAALAMVRCSSLAAETRMPKLLIWIIHLTRLIHCSHSNSVECTTHQNDNHTSTKEDQMEVDKSEKLEPNTIAAWTEKHTWKEAMNALDFALFIVFLVIFTVSTVVFMTVVATAAA